MKIRVSFDLDLDEEPDDQGSVDHWVSGALADGIPGADELDTDDLLNEFNVEWFELNPISEV